MYTGFEDNNDLLIEAQKILLLFQKVHIPSLTQVNNAIQLSYNLDREKYFLFDFIVNSMEAEVSNLI